MFLHGASEALSFQDVADCKACGAPADVFGCPEAPPNNSELARIVGEFVTRLLLHGFDVKSVRVETVSGHVADFGAVEIGLREPGG